MTLSYQLWELVYQYPSQFHLIECIFHTALSAQSVHNTPEISIGTVVADYIMALQALSEFQVRNLPVHSTTMQRRSRADAGLWQHGMQHYSHAFVSIMIEDIDVLSWIQGA